MNHSFDIEIAKDYGIESAILIENIRFWVLKNKANGNNEHEGRFWVYNSVTAWAELFPYMKESTIRRCLNKLVDDGVLMKGCFNKSAHDRTLWYSFVDESKFISNSTLIEPDLQKNANGLSLNDKCYNEAVINASINSSINADTDPKLDRFDEFWELYNKKNGKKKCLTRWKYLKKSDIDKIFHHLPAYIQSTPDTTYRKNPLTYLNGEHWNDEISSSTAPRISPYGCIETSPDPKYAPTFEIDE